MPPAITWDTVEGLRLWIANVPLCEMSRRLHVARRTITSYAGYHEWPERAGVPRGWTKGRRRSHRAELTLTTNRQKPVRDRASVLLRWERRRYERRVRDQIESARPLLALYDAASKPKRGRPRQDFGRRDAA